MNSNPSLRHNSFRLKSLNGVKRELPTPLFCQVDGLMALMEGEHVGPFNLGNPGEFTMLELAEVCLAQTTKELFNNILGNGKGSCSYWHAYITSFLKYRW